MFTEMLEKILLCQTVHFAHFTIVQSCLAARTLQLLSPGESLNRCGGFS